VCIEDYDHHCVFFSKCIGGGNLYYFWGAIAMLLVNFVLIATVIIFDQLGEASSVGKGNKLHQQAPPSLGVAVEEQLDTLIDTMFLGGVG